MKHMSCKDLGGSCETTISGNTPEEMLDNGKKHLLSHPEMLAQMMRSTPEDGKKWMADFMKKWESTPDAK